LIAWKAVCHDLGLDKKIASVTYVSTDCMRGGLDERLTNIFCDQLAYFEIFSCSQAAALQTSVKDTAKTSTLLMDAEQAEHL